MSIKVSGENLENISNAWIAYEKWKFKIAVAVLGVTGLVTLYFLNWLPKIFNL